MANSISHLIPLLLQVSTWFANARRRLKKENKMTWEPRNKTESHDEESAAKREDSKEEEDAASFREEEKPLRMHTGLDNAAGT
ncbi:hypothetical protein AVEN_183673-1 [Araneus ventricosus]|uniref:Homeobox domain-containing protein n=1 Tax=Araneus ventricosus TaxID=182803 RepID=A0A4Y2F5J4_ARAVE|nr:hypothetical protein AVEN_103621-1 [Araneus ventricosus]GBM35342.1 hypothetical protein AVEN_263023-1 [Araneus ventricosus]GBM35569.1 hypothetical protein AVEN_183673-1 [Araneus ventricosus]